MSYMMQPVYQGSGHTLEHPDGHGDGILRDDALADILEFITTSAKRRLGEGRALRAVLP